MNNQKLEAKVKSICSSEAYLKGYISMINVLLALELLTKKDYEDWRRGKVPYLEKVCHTNLSKLSFIQKCVDAYAREHKYKASQTVYQTWGKQKKLLIFSKSGTKNIEEHYARHYVDSLRIKELKEKKTKNDNSRVESNQIVAE